MTSDQMASPAGRAKEDDDEIPAQDAGGELTAERPGELEVEEDEEEPEQKVTWGELFFDLVWVLGITEIAATLAGAKGVGDVASVLLLLIPLWWGWNSATLLGNATGEALDTARGRLLLFALGGAGVTMAVSIPGAWDHTGLPFALGYVALRLVLWLEMRRLAHVGNKHFEPYSVGLMLSGPLYLAGAVLDDEWRVLCWALGAAVEVLGPVVFGHRLDNVRFGTGHLAERFGLIVIMALGETVLAMGNQIASGDGGPGGYASLAVGFGIAIGLWWTYFHFGASAVRHSLSTDPVQARIVRDVLNYAHFIYVAAIICVAVGLKKLAAHPFDPAHSFVEYLLAPGVGLYLLGFCYSRWRMFGAPALSRFAGALAALALTPLVAVAPQLVVALLCAVVLLVLNAVEFWVVKTGRRVIFLKMPRLKRDRAINA